MKTIRVTARVPVPKVPITEESILRIVPIPLFFACGATILVALTCLTGLNRIIIAGSVSMFTGFLLWFNKQEEYGLHGRTTPEPPSPQPWNKCCSFFPESFKDPPEKSP